MKKMKGTAEWTFWIILLASIFIISSAFRNDEIGTSITDNKRDHIANILSESNRYFMDLKKKRDVHKQYEYFDISDNRMLDSDALKKSRINQQKHPQVYSDNLVRKDSVSRLILDNAHIRGKDSGGKQNVHTLSIVKQRQEIANPIGKPYGDPDNYQSIGDGIYLMNDDASTTSNYDMQSKQSQDQGSVFYESLMDINKNNVKERQESGNAEKSLHSSSNKEDLSHANINDFSKPLDHIKNVDKVGHEIALEKLGQSNLQMDHYPTESAFSPKTDREALHSIQTNNVEFMNNQNLEGISSSEANIINNIQGRLNDEDKQGYGTESAELENLKTNVGLEYNNIDPPIQNTLTMNDKTQYEEYHKQQRQNDSQHPKNEKNNLYLLDMIKKDSTSSYLRSPTAKKSDMVYENTTVDQRRTQHSNPQNSKHEPSTKNSGKTEKTKDESKQNISDIDTKQNKSLRSRPESHSSKHEVSNTNSSIKYPLSFQIAQHPATMERNSEEDSGTSSDNKVTGPQQYSKTKIISRNSDSNQTLQILTTTAAVQRKHKKQPTKNAQIVGLVNLLNSTNADILRKKSFRKHHRLKHGKHMLDGITKSRVQIKTSKNENVIDVTGKKGVQIDLYIGGTKPQPAEQQRKSNVMQDNDGKTLNIGFPASKMYADSTDSSPVINADGEELSSSDEGSLLIPEEDVTPQLQLNSKLQSEHPAFTKGETNKNNLQGSEVKPTSTDLEDAINGESINSAEIRTAMAESDLNGLNQIKNALDSQDTKNAVEYYDQPNVKLSKERETTLNELSEEFKEAEKSMEEMKSSSSKFESLSGDKVKIVLHLPDHVSTVPTSGKSKATSAITDKIKNKAEKFLSDEKLKESSKQVIENKALEAAKFIANLMEKDKKNATADLNKENVNQDDLFSSQLQSDIDHDGENVPSMAEERLLSHVMHSSAFQNYFMHPTSKDNPSLRIDATGKSSIGDGKEAKKEDPFKELPKGVNVEAEIEAFEKAAKDLSIKTEEYSNLNLPEKGKLATGYSGGLRIIGGKVLGGNVRGGNIMGGVITGGNVSGGKINGGVISGGTFKDGLLVGGEVMNGLVEGGKIRGGKILGGDVKAGLIEGGIVKGGTVEGGHLVNGSIEGGIFKGGEILGGKLLSGEMDGGILKNGTINGGVLKGGIIEDGSLDGGVMLSGTLRGGIVKSGVIKGGVIDKGVIVQDTEVGPGVEIQEGFVKGGRIMVNNLTEKSKVTNNKAKPTQPRDNVQHPIIDSSAYHIEVMPKPTEGNSKRTIDRGTHVIKDVQAQPDSTIPSKTKKVPKKILNAKPIHVSSVSLYPSAKIDEKITRAIRENPQHSVQSREGKINTEVIELPSRKNLQPVNTSQSSDLKLISTVFKEIAEPTNSTRLQPTKAGDKRQYTAVFIPQTQQSQRQIVVMYQQPTVQQVTATQQYISKPTIGDNSLVEHWELTTAKGNGILGNPGTKLFLSKSGLTFRNGHVVLDGVGGYLDAGDYQGNCFSDPEACEHGFTIHLTLKIYRDSVESKRKLFVIDSGATSKDSRGISVWVSEKKISALIVTRENSWCITKILEPYVERWMVLTLAWSKEKGSYMYIDCDHFDDYKSHFTNECEPQCPYCHKTDVATRLMFGRPNKGPHFKVTHMAVGDISLYEKFFEKDEVKSMCEDKKDSKTSEGPKIIQVKQQPQKGSQQQTPTQTVEPLPIMQQSEEPQVLVQQPVSLEGNQLQPETQLHGTVQVSFTSIPTPSQNSAPVMISGQTRSKEIKSSTKVSHKVSSNNTSEKSKLGLHVIEHNNDDGEFVYPTPSGISSKPIVRVTEAPIPLVNYKTDRRSYLYTRKKINSSPPDQGYTIWSAWSPCSKSCGDGVQIAVRFCQNKDDDCTYEGPSKKYKRCNLRICQGDSQLSQTEDSKKSLVFKYRSQMTFNRDEQSEDLKSELNQLKRRR